MSNLVPIHQRQLILPPDIPTVAQLYVMENGTSDLVTIFAEVGLENELSQPVLADSYGVFPPIYTDYSAPVRLLATDEDDNPLDGYPYDDITLLPAETVGAAGITFAPTETVQATNVQVAIEATAALFGDQLALQQRSLTPWATGGTSDAYTITPTPAITAYTSGLAFLIRPNRANGGPATLTANGLGARAMAKISNTGATVALAQNDLRLGHESLFVYNGTQFILTLGRDMPTRVTSGNESYTKFSDGTLICTKLVPNLGPVTTASGSIFTSADINLGDWPFPFVSATYVSHFSVNSILAWVGGPTGESASAIGSVRILRSATSASTDLTVRATGIGRWF